MGTKKQYFHGSATFEGGITGNNSLPTGYRFGPPIVYKDTDEITVGSCKCRNTTDDGDINISTASTDVKITTYGAINGNAQSADLTGTITVTNATNTVS